MNTDNTSISGETIDYGPCAFMDTYHPATVYSSIDTGGRYAYGNQPHIAYWNLSRLAQALLPLLGEGDEAVTVAQAAIDAFPAHFDTAIRAGLLRKIGLAQDREGDDVLAHDLLDRMAQGRADFTLTFRRLCDAAGDDGEADGPVRSLFADPALFDDWAARWRARLALEDGSGAARRDAMRAVNPAFIPRNHRVEAAIVAAEASDFGPFEELLTVLARPYDDQPAFAHYADPPRPEEVVQATFCGT
jgi:uncharacterized protein YdiU (UPF0061 family)